MATKQPYTHAESTLESKPRKGTATKIKLFSSCFVIVMPLLLAACSGQSTNPTGAASTITSSIASSSVNTGTLVGKWQAVAGSKTIFDTMEFTENKQFYATQPGNDLQGTYGITDGNNVAGKVRWEAGGIAMVADFSVSSDGMKMTWLGQFEYERV